AGENQVVTLPVHVAATDAQCGFGVQATVPLLFAQRADAEVAGVAVTTHVVVVERVVGLVTAPAAFEKTAEGQCATVFSQSVGHTGNEIDGVDANMRAGGVFGMTALNGAECGEATFQPGLFHGLRHAGAGGQFATLG